MNEALENELTGGNFKRVNKVLLDGCLCFGPFGGAATAIVISAATAALLCG